MKAIFLLLVLLNLAYFYYQGSAEEDAKTSVLLTQPALPAGAVPLVLLRERGLGGGEAEPDSVALSTEQPSPQVAKKTEPEAPVLASPPQLSVNPPAPQPQKSAEAACFTFGPFDDPDLAERAVKATSDLGISVERRQESQRTPKGYWVYLPPSTSYQAAKRKVAELQKKDLTDLFIMGKGSQQNAISLGLFKSREAAEDRLKQVQELGLKAEFETQYRVSEQSWLDMSVPGDKTSIIAELTEMAEGFSEARLTQRKCQ